MKIWRSRKRIPREEWESFFDYLRYGEKYDSEVCNDFALGRGFYIKAMSDLKAEQFFTALDTLYLSFEYFKKAEVYPYAFDCLAKINELMND